MQNKPDNILIICFSFPPFPGIGGRRWAKFAKYLSKNGHKVYTLAAKNESDVESEWTKDVTNAISYTIPLGFSKVLSFTPTTFFKKGIYKLLWKISPFIIKGNTHDKIFFIKKNLLSSAENIINKHQINTVIVSIPPYKMAYYLLPLKQLFPNVKLIVDYRDPWTDNKSYHGFSNITATRLKEEEKYELAVLNTYDIVLDVNNNSLEILKQKIKNKNKFHHLPNGFDPDDYSINEQQTLAKDDKIRFIYSGSFYPNLIYLLKPLLACLNQIKKQDPDLYSRLEFNFYGNMDHLAKEYIHAHGSEIVKCYGNISHKNIIQAINASDYCMLFSALDHGSAFNTKFYEYVFLRKPIVYFGPEGNLSDYLQKQRIGITLTPEMLELSEKNVLSDLIKNNDLFNKEANINSFNIEVITEKLIEIIKV
ncbi:MAG: hypothetical protein V4506_12080 [Bacteroidota bacterium]